MNNLSIVYMPIKNTSTDFAGGCVFASQIEYYCSNSRIAMWQ